MNSRRMAAVLAVFMVAELAACSKPGSGAPTNVAQPASVLTVTAVTPQAQTWPQLVQASGPLSAWQEIIVTPETGGLQLVELKVDVGAQVKRGQLLARLADDSVRNDLRKQDAAVAQARAALNQAQSNLRRARMAEDSGALSAQKIEEYRITAETAQASLNSAQADLDSIRLKLSQTRVLAVDDGIVSSKSAMLGNVVGAGAELFRLVRQGRVEWRPELDAQQLETVKPGRVARVALADGRVVQGDVRMVSPTLSTSTGRGTVYVSLPAGSGARPGTFGSGSIELDDKSALTLPAGAVVLRDGRAYVYLLGSDSKVTSRPVIVGRRRGERVEILSGLEAGTRVVASGGAFLSDGAYVTVTNAQTSVDVSGSNAGARR